jgi:hypothetical protein
LTDEEVRARLARLREGDSVALGLALLNALQMATVFLVYRADAFSTWMAAVLLATVAGALIHRAVVHRRDSRSTSDEVRQEYAKALATSLANARMGKSLLWVWLGLTAFNGYVFLDTTSSLGRPTGLSMSMMGVLMSIAQFRQWKIVLPRLEREKSEVLQGASS